MPEKPTWIKDNAFSIFNLIMILAATTYSLGSQQAKIAVVESNYEARIVALEKKTDDLAVLKNIVQTQSDNIRQLSDIVRSDHDVLIRLTLPKN